MAEAKKIPERSEIPEQYTWDLTAIYPSDEAWQASWQEIRTKGAQLADFAGRLGESAETLYRFLELEQAVSVGIQNLGNYAMRRRDEDTRRAEYQAMSGKVISLYVEIDGLTAFATPELLKISPETLEKFYAEKPGLAIYRRYFENIQRKKVHILSDAEEALLAAAGDLLQSPEDIFSKLENADLTFRNAYDSAGEAHIVSNASYMLCMQSEDRILRKSAFESMYATFGGMKNTCAAVLGAQIKGLAFTAKARRYETTLEAALDENHVPTEVYYNLIKTVNANLSKLHRYVRLRKRLLGVDELHMYDIGAPMISGVKWEIPYEKARETAYAALAPMGERYRAIIKEGFNNRWIDVYENVGKCAGGYMAGALAHPCVLLNYKNNMESMFTLIHEMGHAVHSYLSNAAQPPVYRNYVIFVAEVASTCNEALLMAHLLKTTTDKRERLSLLNYYLEQFKGTLYRQTMFAEFELRLNELYAQGETLTAELLCKEYAALNAKYYGPDMAQDEEIALEWARIPHLYYDYYVYQYATGYAAAVALSQRILTGGEAAVKDYLGFLTGGCSKDPIELLKGAGVDMASPAPIQAALDQFGEVLDQMEALLD